MNGYVLEPFILVSVKQMSVNLKEDQVADVLAGLNHHVTV